MGPYDTVIVTAQPFETQAVLAYLHEVREEAHPGEMVVYTGQFRGKQRALGVVVARMGSGKTATLVLSAKRLISFYQPTLLCSVGLASEVQEVRPGDVVVATKVYAFESSPTAPGVEPRREVWYASATVLQRARTEAHSQTWLAQLGDSRPDPAPRVLFGALAQGEQSLPFMPSRSAPQLPTPYADVLALEQDEARVLAAIGMGSSVPAVVIRGIADLREGNANADGLGMRRRAAHHAAAFTFELLTALDQDMLLPLLSPEPGVWKEEREEEQWVRARFQETRGIPPRLPGWDAIVQQRGVASARQTDLPLVEVRPDQSHRGKQEDIARACQVWGESLARLQQEFETKGTRRAVAWQGESTTIQDLEAFLDARLSNGDLINDEQRDPWQVMASLVETLVFVLSPHPPHWTHDIQEEERAIALQACQDLRVLLADLQAHTASADGFARQLPFENSVN